MNGLKRSLQFNSIFMMLKMYLNVMSYLGEKKKNLKRYCLFMKDKSKARHFTSEIQPMNSKNRSLLCTISTNHVAVSSLMLAGAQNPILLCLWCKFWFKICFCLNNVAYNLSHFENDWDTMMRLYMCTSTSAEAFYIYVHNFFQKFQLIPSFCFQVVDDYVCFNASI